MNITLTNRRLAVAAIAAAAAAITVVGVSHARADSTPVDDPPEASRLITVVGTGTVTVDPDRAIVHFGVSATSPSGAAAMEDVNASSNAVVDALFAIGVTQEDIATDISLHEVWDDDYEVVIGYEAALDVSVTVDGIDADPGRVGEVLDTAQEVGGAGFTISGVAFTYADVESLREQARVAAGADARRAAEDIAEGAGATVGDVITLSLGDGWVPPTTVYADAMPAAPALDGEAPAPVLPGDLDFTVTVSATFELN
jgi:uncharacterized protein YggE